MFVPMDTVAIENGWSYAKMAALYETWLTLQVTSLDPHVAAAATVTPPKPASLHVPHLHVPLMFVSAHALPWLDLNTCSCFCW